MPAKILPHILLLQLLLPTCFSLTIKLPKVWISEVYIGDNPEDDFIEFYDGGSGNVSFKNFTLDVTINNSSEKYYLDRLQTNSEGFLVFNATNISWRKHIRDWLRRLDNVTIEFNLTHSLMNQTITRRHFQANLVICYEEVAPILLVSNVSTKGRANKCPLSPVHIEQVSLRNDSTFDVILHSDGLPKWKLKSLMVNVEVDGNSQHNSSLDQFTTDESENYKLNFPLTLEQEQTVAVLLNFIANTSGPILLDGVAFGKSQKSLQKLPKIWTYPDLYQSREQEIQYIELNSNNASMVKFCHCNLFSMFFAASELTNCSVLCFHYNNQRPREPLPVTDPKDISTSASSISSVSGTTPSSSSSSSSSNTAMTTALPSMTSTTNSSEMTTNVNGTTNSASVSSTSMLAPNVTNAEVFNETSTVSVQITTTSNGSTTIHETSTSNSTSVDYTEETTTINSTDSKETTTSNFTDVTSLDNNTTNAPTAETPHTSFSSSSSTQTTTQTATTITSAKIVPNDDLKINEIRVGQKLSSNNWIELKGTPSNFPSEYKLVWSDLDEKTKFPLDFNNSLTETQHLMNIDQKKKDYDDFLKHLSQKSGVLNLYKVSSNELVDCVTYMRSDVPVEERKKAVLQKLCSQHTPVLITEREMIAGWTINYCGSNHFQVTRPSYNTSDNICPSTRHRILSMVLKDVPKTKDFESLLKYEFVRKISEKKNCMISKDFLKISNVTTHYKDEHYTLVTVLLYGYNASHLQTLYKGYESLFIQNKTVFKINEKSITVYRESTFVYKTEDDSSNASVTVAVLLSLLAIFILIVVTVCLYMRYKKKNLTNLFNKLYFKPDQDDLLVNMEEVGSQESHFNNPYYNQLSV